jgi:6-pyruvoyltetrahydropterin/6-carboxytetrahydropterin synthase
MNERFELSRSLFFESAHFLPHAPEGHKCRRMHGHSFRAEIWIEGPLDKVAGWVIDFADLDASLAPIRKELDHQVLNEVPGLANPTSEELGRWLWDRCGAALPPGIDLTQVVIHETCESAVRYRADPSQPPSQE